MDKLNNYMSDFFKKGVYLLCSDGDCDSNYFRKVSYEKSFICGSFWSISGLSVSSIDISEEDIFKVLKTLKLCMMDVDISVDQVYDLYNPTAKAFSQYTDECLYDCNIQSTLYAIQIYYMVKNFEKFKEFDLSELLPNDDELESIITFIISLYDKKIGCFYNSLCSKYSDLRHTMSALCAFNLCNKLLGLNDNDILEEMNTYFNLDLTFEFLKSHFNPDGGITLISNSQSHVAGVFCCLGSLIFINKLDCISTTRMKMLVSWLLERISASGGMNGRVGKSNDICYIWWNLASLALIKQNYKKSISIFNENVAFKIKRFIEESQNSDGGFSSNKSHNSSDPYHSFTVILSMSLINEVFTFTNIKQIEPLYAIPKLLN